MFNPNGKCREAYTQQTAVQISTNEIQSWLEWAGQRLLSISVSRVKPEGYRSYWPDYPDDKNTAYGYSNIRIRPIPPSKDEIPLMDEVLDLVKLSSNEIHRRVINARLLIIPANQRHLYSWNKIAFMISSDPGTARNYHKRGLVSISSKLDLDRVDHFRTSLGLTQIPD